MQKKLKMLVVGWDGATFDMLGPLADQGRLPNVKHLMQTGAWGKMASTIPALTPTAWTSIATGANPGRHGIFDAIMFSRQTRELSFVSAARRGAAPMWSLLNLGGYRCGVLNVPLTYPPDPVDGFFVSGMFTPDGAADFIHPPELAAELKTAFPDYRIEARWQNAPGTYLADLGRMIDSRVELALYLLEKHSVDFLFVTFIASDRVQHFFWHYMDPSHPEHTRFGRAVADVYAHLDKALGRLLAARDQDAHVAMVSDHGAGPLHHAFFLNNWLLKNGYLFLKEDAQKLFGRSGGFSLARSVKDAARKVLPAKVIEKLKPKGGIQGANAVNRFLSWIDWDKTLAFSEGVGGAIYLNGKGLDKTVSTGLCQKLLAIKGPDGQNVIGKIHRREDIYTGDRLQDAPDLILSCNTGYQVIAPNEFFYFNTKMEDEYFIRHRWSGRHEPNGIFLLGGPHVKSGQELTNINVMDVAPTILHLMGQDVPNNMDGRVLDQALDADWLVAHPVRTRAAETVKAGDSGLSEAEEADIRDRLIDLGYME